MKQILFATAATLSLMAAAPLALAQSQTTTPQPSYSQTQAPQPAETAVAPSETTQTPAATAATPMHGEHATTTTAETAESDEQLAAQTEPVSPTETDTSSEQQAVAHASNETASVSLISAEAMNESAIEAGLRGTPMAAADVCAPRDVSLSANSLNRHTRQQLRFAADRASVCDINSVTVTAPAGRGEAVRALLVDHGVDAASIEVQQGSELGVEMNFAGIATSSDYFASLYNPQVLASNEPNAAATSAMPALPETTDPSAVDPQHNQNETEEAESTTL